MQTVIKNVVLVVESAKLMFHPKSNHVHSKLMVQRFAIVSEKIKRIS